METIRDHYATLRVPPDADAAALRKAYRALMRRHHPDLNLDAEASDRCQAINEAYACLSDRSKRAHYDAQYRAQRAASPTLSPRAYRQIWGAQFAERSARDAAGQPQSRKAALIGAAIVKTILTFAATSAVDTESPLKAGLGASPPANPPATLRMAPPLSRPAR